MVKAFYDCALSNGIKFTVCVVFHIIPTILDHIQCLKKMYTQFSRLFFSESIKDRDVKF